MTRLMIEPTTITMARAAWETILAALEGQIDALLDDYAEGADYHGEAIPELIDSWYTIANEAGVDQATMAAYRTAKREDFQIATARYAAGRSSCPEPDGQRPIPTPFTEEGENVPGHDAMMKLQGYCPWCGKGE
jgi:hypothetical protein